MIKKLTSKIWAVMLLALVASCVDDAVEGLTGKYEAPTPVSLQSVTAGEAIKEKTRRIFPVTLGSGNDVLTMQFVGDSYYLPAATFNPAEEKDAKKGNYIVGANGSKYNDVAIVKGNMYVTKDGDNYGFKGVLWLADNSVKEFSAQGTLVYLPDPEPVALTQVFTATSNVANGTTSVTVQLATADITAQYNPATWSTEYTGTGNFLAVDFYSADGFLYPGTYTPSAAGGVIAEGNYGIGWDPGDLWGIGIEFANWGTCWWTVNEGVTSAANISKGNITVEKSGSIYTVTINNGDVFAQYVGKIEALDPDAASATPAVELSKCIAATNNAANGTPTITLYLATENVNGENGMYGWSFSGEGNYLALDLYSADGTLSTGVYTACAEGGQVTEGTFGIGWHPGDIFGWGMDFDNWGTCWWTVGAGESTAEKITEGTVLVSKDGDNYKIEGAFGELNVVYNGPVTVQ